MPEEEQSSPAASSCPLQKMTLHVQLQCKNLREDLNELSPEIMERLYNQPDTCLALRPLANSYVTLMLFLDQPLPLAAVALWVETVKSKDHEQCVSVLSGLRLWHSQQLQGGLIVLLGGVAGVWVLTDMSVMWRVWISMPWSAERLYSTSWWAVPGPHSGRPHENVGTTPLRDRYELTLPVKSFITPTH
uniref:General transcription factor IIH subunit 4 n=1 Tax=Hucho hucho TaxID=62062 RepID=A0A4W5MDM0_9TELE